MKIRDASKSQGDPRGSATIVVLALLSIMAIYTTIEFTAARRLQNNLRLIERHQVQRLKTSSQSGGPQASDNLNGQGSTH